MNIYDTPAVLHYLLNKTGQSSLHYIGHSQGTLQLFARLSYDHELAKKVRLDSIQIHIFSNNLLNVTQADMRIVEKINY